MSNIPTFLSVVLSGTAGVFASMAWKDADGEARKWLGWGAAICLIPVILLIIAIVLLLFTFGISLFLLTLLGVASITLVIGAGFLIYGTILLANIENRTDKQNSALRNAIIASVIAGAGAMFILVGLLFKLSDKSQKRRK
jgi:hypothetical protein